MAITTNLDHSYGATAPIDEVETRPRASRRISWGAVFAGVVMVLAAQILLSMLGLGVGFSTVDPAQNGGTPSASSLSIGAGLWWGASYLLALVIGGYVAARLAAIATPLEGVLHGLLAWAFALLFAVYLLSTALGGIIGGAFNAVSGALSTAGQTVKEAAPQIAQAAGITPEVVQQRAKDLLSAAPTGADPTTLTAEDAQREMAANLGTLVTGDDQAKEAARDRITAIVAAQANATPEEARQRLDKLEAQATQTKNQAVEQAKTVGDKATDGLARASLMALATLLLGAGAAGLAAISARAAAIVSNGRSSHHFLTGRGDSSLSPRPSASAAVKRPSMGDHSDLLCAEERPTTCRQSHA